MRESESEREGLSNCSLAGLQTTEGWREGEWSGSVLTTEGLAVQTHSQGHGSRSPVHKPDYSPAVTLLSVCLSLSLPPSHFLSLTLSLYLSLSFCLSLCLSLSSTFSIPPSLSLSLPPSLSLPLSLSMLCK